MIIALDGTPLSEPTGGVARYTWELAHTLAEEFPEDQYWLLSDQPFAMPVDRPRNLHSGSRPQSPVDRRWWLWGLQREMDRRGVELFHGTDFSVPYVPRGRPNVMTLHDLSPWMDEAWNHATPRVRRRTPRLLQFGLVKRVITPSEAVRKAAIARFELDPEEVTAVPLAARALFRPVEGRASEIPYFLFVGTIEARKNVDRLIAAWRAVCEVDVCELWMVGRVREGYALPEDLEGVRLLGAVEDAGLPELYSGAVAFVYPSLYEGFGLPVLEAMQCGCPVITSCDAALVEVSGDAALHVRAEDTHGLSQMMRALLWDRTRRGELRERGLKRAGSFSWTNTARKTRDVYAQACR